VVVPDYQLKNPHIYQFIHSAVKSFPFLFVFGLHHKVTALMHLSSNELTV